MDWFKFTIFVIWAIIAATYIWQMSERDTIMPNIIETKFGRHSIIAKLISITLAVIIIGGAIVMLFVFIDACWDKTHPGELIVNIKQGE